MEKYKAFTVSLVVAAAIGFFHGLQYISDPENHVFKDNNFETAVHGNKINIVGWYHGGRERELGELALSDAITKGKEGDCKSAQIILEAILRGQVSQFKEGLRVYNTLEEIYQKSPFQVLAIELSPEQYKTAYIDSDTNTDFSTQYLSVFNKFCPEQSKLFRDLYLIYPGPDVLFAMDKKNLVKIVPTGDNDLMTGALSHYTEDTRNFAQNVEQLSPEGQSAYKTFFKAAKRGKVIPEAQILTIISSVQEPEKSKIKNYIDSVNSVYSYHEKRENRYVEEILKFKSDVVLLIGNAHVANIKTILESAAK